MAEMCIKKYDEGNRDPYLDVKRVKAGEVVCIEEDGYGWKAHERSIYDIVKLPGVPVTALSGFLSPEPGDEKTNRMLQRRAFRFDVASWRATGKKSLNLVDALTLQLSKPTIPDPNIL